MGPAGWRDSEKCGQEIDSSWSVLEILSHPYSFISNLARPFGEIRSPTDSQFTREQSEEEMTWPMDTISKRSGLRTQDSFFKPSSRAGAGEEEVRKSTQTEALQGTPQAGQGRLVLKDTPVCPLPLQQMKSPEFKEEGRKSLKTRQEEWHHSLPEIIKMCV